MEALTAREASDFLSQLADRLSESKQEIWSEGPLAIALDEIASMAGLLPSEWCEETWRDLAVLLNNASIQLWETGEAALSLAILGHAIQILEDRAISDATLLPDLAMVLNNYSNQLGHLGRERPALEAIEKAVRIQRGVCGTETYRGTVELALFLNNLCLRQAECGLQRESLLSIREAAEVFRLIYAEDPGRYRADLAMVLDNMSLRLERCGLSSESIAAMAEAASLYRQLDVQATGSEHRRHLMALLNRLGPRLARMGYQSHARAVDEELAALMSDSAYLGRVQ